MKAIIPQNFELKKHIQQYPPQQYGIDKFDEDHALFLLSQIILAPSQDQQLLDQMDWQTCYVPLYSGFLQKHVHEYRQYMTYFVQTWVIECDNQFIRRIDRPGEEKSYGYRFLAPYDTSDLKTLTYRKNFTNVLKRKKRNTVKPLKGEYDHLIKNLWPVCNLSVDLDSGLKLAQAKRAYFTKHPNKRKSEYNKKRHKFEVKDPIVQYKCTKANLLSLHAGETHIVVDESGKRFHTVLTNMQKDNRHLLTYRGEYLTSFDIKNSQPYFVTALFNRNMYLNNPKGVNLFTINKNLLKDFPTDLGKTNGFFEAFENPDVIRYKSLVSNVDGNPSDLYTYMWQEFEKQGKHYSSRDEVKPVMYEVLFTANKYSTDLKTQFKLLFPTVDELLRKFKSTNKKLLPCLLQSIESFVVLKVITKRMAKQYPKAPLFTIHDSIATTYQYSDQLRIVMEEELTKFTGLPPKLSKEEWNLSTFNRILEEYQQ